MKTNIENTLQKKDKITMVQLNGDANIQTDGHTYTHKVHGRVCAKRNQNNVHMNTHTHAPSYLSHTRTHKHTHTQLPVYDKINQLHFVFFS